MNRWIIDRFEENLDGENLAVLGSADSDSAASNSLDSIVCPVANLPKGAKEGDVIIRKGDRFLPDPEETVARAHRIRERFERLKKR